MLRLQKAPRIRVHERFDSDRESLPFPRGGVFGRINEAHDESTQNGAPVQAEYAAQILRTIDDMQSSLDTLDRELGAELERELNQLGGVVARIGETSATDWPPNAA